MRTLASLFVIMLLVGVLLLTGCNSQTNEAEVVNDVAVGYTIYLSDGVGVAPVHTKVREFEVRLVGGDDGFFPTTYEANLGDTVKLLFRFQNPQFVTIEDMGIGTNIDSQTIEFVAEEQGVFEMICVTCEPSAMAWIVVN